MADEQQYHEINEFLRAAQPANKPSSPDEQQYSELTAFLRGQGQTNAEIDLILARVRQYEAETQQDSIMDAIGNGSLDLAALIKEVLGEKK